MFRSHCHHEPEINKIRVDLILSATIEYIFSCQIHVDVLNLTQSLKSPRRPELLEGLVAHVQLAPIDRAHLDSM